MKQERDCGIEERMWNRREIVEQERDYGIGERLWNRGEIM